MVGAGALSLGMVGVFAFPAYAVDESVPVPDGAPAQRLVTEEVTDVVLPLEGPTAELDQETIELEQQAAAAEQQREQEAQTQAQQQQQTAAAALDLPSGAGAQGLLSAAMAQLGQGQDCTALVERSLRAIGFPAGDLGTSVADYARYGTVVTSGGYAPGDILIWPGAHVAIYAGNGQAVNGGMNGTTMLYSASGTMLGAPSVAVRIG